MKDYSNEQLIELFDGKEIKPPDLPDSSEMKNDLFVPPFAQNEEAVEPEGKRRKKRKPKKRGGVWALPAYKYTFDTYKECQFRFRKCNRDSRDICKEVTGNLKKMMVNIELFHWQVKPATVLADTVEMALETAVIIRALKDIGELSTKDFAIICQYSSQMLSHLMKWNNHHNKAAHRTEGVDNIL